MKNYITLITLAFILTLAAGCGKSGSDDKEVAKLLSSEQNVAQLESIDIKDEKVKLLYKFSKGDVYNYRLSTTTTSIQEIQADSSLKSEAEQKVIYEFNFEVIDVDDENIAEMNAKITSIKLEAKVDNQIVKFDSKAKNKLEDKQKFIEYESINNQQFRIRVTNSGEIVDVSRLEKMVDKMNSLSPQKQELTPEQKSGFAKNFGDAAIRPITQLVFREFSDTEVNKSSTWEKSYQNKIAVFDVTNIAKFKVEDFVNVNDDRTAKISAKLSIIAQGKKEGSENGITYKFDDPKVTGGGTIFFSIDNGRLLRSETKTELVLSVLMSGKNALQKIEKTHRKEITVNINKVELI